MLLAKYHVDDAVTFFSTSDFWDVPLDPNPQASSYQPPYYIVAKDLARNDDSAAFQLTTAMTKFKRDFLAAYISASSDPDSYGKITVLKVPGEVNGPKQANTRIKTEPSVSQQIGIIERTNQIRWGNLLTLPVAGGGLLYVEPVYASPGTSDASSSYPRLIRVAMLYGDKVGYGATVQEALTGLFGPVVAGAATKPLPAAGPPGAAAPAAPPPSPGAIPPDGSSASPPASATPAPGAVPPGGPPVQLTAPKAAALQEVQNALDGLHQAQRSGNFADYGAALQRLDDAMAKYANTR
jgi:uncharacterized membrane protein (UPF0182 family)